MTKESYGGYRRKTDAQNLADAVELMLPHIRTVADMGAHMRAMAAELHRLDAENESLRAMSALIAAAEREACAKLCDELWDRGVPGMANDCAIAIRAKGETK